jgi:hypothetical protein
MSNRPLILAIIEDLKEATLEQEIDEYLEGPDLE